MKMLLENMYAYRFFENEKGPLDTIRKYSIDEIDEMGRNTGVANIRAIYHNRVNMENLMLNLFKRNGGKPQIIYPLYFAIYDALPDTNKLHVRFNNPMCLKIPMKEFEKKHVSFTYGLSTHAFTRKDNHPCRRKLLTWDEAQEVINIIPFDEKEDLWLEMQVWDEKLIEEYFNANQETVFPVKVEERLSDEDKKRLRQRYDSYLSMFNSNNYFEPDGLHGIMHAMRVLILTQKIADLNDLSDDEKRLLRYCAIYHDIGRVNDASDYEHGYSSYAKMIKRNLLPDEFEVEKKNIVQFIIENHPYDVKTVQEKIGKYDIVDQGLAIKLFCVFRDADILDMCRYGSVNKHFLHFMSSRDLVPFAFQLLLIYREKSRYE